MRGIIPGGINPDLVSLAGSVVVWWSMVEGALTHDVISLNIMPKVAADNECWPVQISTKRLISQWARARRIVHADWTDKHLNLESVVTQLRDCAAIRHRLVHSFWGYGTPTQPREDFIISSVKPSRTNKNAIEFDRYLIDVESLDTLNDRMRYLYHEIMAAAARLHFDLIGKQHVAPTAPKDPTAAPIDGRLLPPKPILAR